jgi:hypothetical protein
MPFKFLHHLLAFLDDAHDRIARLAPGGRIQFGKYLLQPIDVLLRLPLADFRTPASVRELEPSPSWARHACEIVHQAPRDLLREPRDC